MRSPSPTLTVGRAMRDAADRLGDRLEARRILEAACGLSSAGLIRSLDDGLDETAAARVAELVERRLAGEPLQHVVGRWGFRTLDVVVDGRALVPRPETELLVESALSVADLPVDPVALDLGTGSGVIALSLTAEHPAIEVFAVDRSPAALELAGENLACLPEPVRRRVHLLEGSWYEPLPDRLRGRVDLVLANPPYLADAEWDGLDPVVRHFDPYEALVAGPSGLEAIDAVVRGALDWLAPAGTLLVEIAPGQAGGVVGVGEAAGFGRVEVLKDLAGLARILVAQR